MALTQVTGPYPIFTDLDGTPLDDGYLYIGEVNDDPETNPIQVYWDANLTIPASQPIRTSNGYAYRNGTPALLYTAGAFSITIRNKREEFVLYSPVGYGFDPAAVSASVVKNDFIGDGVEVNFTLSAAPSTILATNVFINGVYQEKDSYSILGNVLTFSIAPPLNSSIEVMTNETGGINSGNATAITYTASFPGATLQTVQTKLEQTVSVKDFGAVGDGVADDTAAIQAAIAAVGALGGGTVSFVNGETYLVSDIILLQTNVSLIGNGCTISVNPLNYTGGITRFYGVFSTVNITARPLTILWRIGTGSISFENILIDGFTFQINRDGAVLTAGQMLVSEINIIRFEDARNCNVTNCQFIDQQTIGNNNGSQVVFFVRSENCAFSKNYGTNVGLFWSAECKMTIIDSNYIPVSVGTCIETVAGQSYRITNNRSGLTWAGVSSIGVNSKQCVISGNTVDEAALTGITIGHPTSSGGANSYNLPLDADFSTCRDNYILSGDDLTVNHGYIGILVQAASYITIAENTILNLRKKATLNDRAGGVLVQPDAVASATGIRIEKNRISTANNGIHVVRGEAVVAEENSIRDAYAGFYYEASANSPRITINDNFIAECDRAINLNNGYAEVSGNFCSVIANASFSLAFSRGNFRIENNFLSECGEIALLSVKSVALIGNVIENAVVKARTGTLDNSSTAGTATIDQITVIANNHPGTTDMLRIVNVLGQSPRVLETTVPTQFRTTSYNVGSLPTSSAGLSTGDLYNDTGTVKVV